MTITAAADARSAIELSWHRSTLSGIAPAGSPIGDDQVADIDEGSHLLRAARPVLTNVAEMLLGTRYSLLLADGEGRIVHRWFDEPMLEATLDELGVRVGASGAEDVLGTNAIGTALETRSGISVRGDEHFIEPFKSFTCYGHPIVHPITRRVVGVLDISGAARDGNPLLAPFLMRAVDDIELRLLGHAKASERALLAAFQAESGRRGRAVAVMGGETVLTTRAAVDLLAPGDYATLRLMVDDRSTIDGRAQAVVLSSGATVDVSMSRVDGTTDGVLFRLVPSTYPSGRRVETAFATLDHPILVHGPAGAGRTTEARRLAPDALVINASSLVVEGETAWVTKLRSLLDTTSRVCVDNLDLLPDSIATLLVEIVAQGRPLVVTCRPVERLTGLQATLAAMITDQVELAPLHERAAEIGTLAMRIVRELNPAADIRLLPSVVEALGSRSWPGNFHELRAVMAEVVARRSLGDVTVGDLPESYRTVVRSRVLGGRERAEREAIVESLRRHKGNKARSALDLGISRTTLYARMRALRIDSWPPTQTV